ncbi:hypothetical protein SAY87_006833 [Trapa incisa]|uniref:Uncharacterized protein n=1 Tax=Trapa incisa TaxID=236973 RepID=A0AAN7PZH8_9MYRT|nr:hypothetical protein SAY87_006833 [Trapa incisa]
MASYLSNVNIFMTFSKLSCLSLVVKRQPRVKETMNVSIVSSITIKPSYVSGRPPPTTAYIPLSSFDKLAGRLGKNQKGEDVILLNDHGVKFVEASVDSRLDQAMIFPEPSRDILSLHPPKKGIAELLQVQITRFACSSVVIGITFLHTVADGQSIGNFLVSWGRACWGLDIGPLPLHDRLSFFKLRYPPVIEFEHIGLEYTRKKPLDDKAVRWDEVALDDLVMHEVHFSADFIAKVKARTSPSFVPSVVTNGQKRTTYSTFECLVAHLWRAITRARMLDASEITKMKIAVNGRSRMNPRIPNQYFGNLVLWATPTARVKDLLSGPVSLPVELIHEGIAKIDDRYLQSFINFSETRLKHDSDAIPFPIAEKSARCPNIEVYSWLKLPLCDLDLGFGSPYMFMPAHCPVEGILFILPAHTGDGDIDVFVTLFKNQLDAFRQNCQILD